MGIISLTRDSIGEVGSAPGTVKMLTTDNLATVTTAGYIKNSVTDVQLSNLDVVEAIYSYNTFTNIGTYDTFTVSISGGVITLAQWMNPAEVVLPVTAGNIAIFSGTSGTIADGPVAGNKVLTSALTTPDVGSNLIAFDITVGQAALASGGSVILYTSSGSKQYKVRSLQLNSGGTNFSGGGGDRLGQVTDGTTVYSVIPAATMQSLVNAQWGVTALPNPASAAINTSTAAGVDLVFKYSGGTTDYTAGSLVISGLLQRVA